MRRRAQGGHPFSQLMRLDDLTYVLSGELPTVLGHATRLRECLLQLSPDFTVACVRWHSLTLISAPKWIKKTNCETRCHPQAVDSPVLWCVSLRRSQGATEVQSTLSSASLGGSSLRIRLHLLWQVWVWPWFHV